MAPTEPTPLRRPPIRQSTLVRSDAEHTFDAFVRTISEWWPVRPYSIGQDNVASVTFERQLGGRVYETLRRVSHGQPDRAAGEALVASTTRQL